MKTKAFLFFILCIVLSACTIQKNIADETVSNDEILSVKADENLQELTKNEGAISEKKADTEAKAVIRKGASFSSVGAIRNFDMPEPRTKNI